MTLPTALGIDVGEVRKGLDAVVLDERRRVVDQRRGVGIGDLPDLIASIKPDVIGIDSPPSWRRAEKLRRAERELRRLGIQSYATPQAEHSDHRFYAWMRQGFEVFEAAARAGYPRYGEGSVRGSAIEVFPHASAVVMAGTLRPQEVRKDRWRREVLAAQGVRTKPLTTPDLVDGALAALTGLFALEDHFSAPGDPDDGVIVVPVRELPDRAYARAAAAQAT